MKNISYLFVLLLTFAGCKKSENQANVDFVKVQFKKETDYPVFVKYDGIKNTLIGKDYVAVPPGEQKFEIYNAATGEKVIDTVVNITQAITYYVYIPEGAVAPVLVTELPAPPPPPAGPFDGMTPTPDGYMSIKVHHNLAAVLGYEKVDLKLLASINSSAFEVFATIPNVTATLGKDFILVQRPLKAGVQQQRFRFQFVKSDTQELVQASDGTPYITGPLALALTSNAFILNFNPVETSATTGVASEGKYYNFTLLVEASQ